MAEWTNARLLKSRETRVSVGSNPTPSAGQRLFRDPPWPRCPGPSSEIDLDLGHVTVMHRLHPLHPGLGHGRDGGRPAHDVREVSGGRTSLLRHIHDGIHGKDLREAEPVLGIHAAEVTRLQPFDVLDRQELLRCVHDHLLARVGAPHGRPPGAHIAPPPRRPHRPAVPRCPVAAGVQALAVRSSCNLRLRTLPLGSRGSSSTNSMDRGHLKSARCTDSRSRMTSASAVAPALSSTTAWTMCPMRSSGRPMTAESTTSGSAARAFSTSAG